MVHLGMQLGFVVLACASTTALSLTEGEICDSVTI